MNLADLPEWKHMIRTLGNFKFPQIKAVSDPLIEYIYVTKIFT